MSNYELHHGPVRKVVFVLIDGIGDVSIESLDFKTPLEAIDCPNFDAIAAGGLNGLLDPVEPGVACGSDTAHLSILGYDPRKCYRGRGAFEAMGAGIDMERGDVAFKSNFATMEDDQVNVKLRRVDRGFPAWGRPLCDYLNGTKLDSFPDVTVSVKYATEHRCGVRIRGPRLTDQLCGTDPLKDGRPLLRCLPLNDTAEAIRTAAVVNEVSDTFRRRLREHPLYAERRAAGLPAADVILLRGPGERLEVPPFSERHALRAFAIAPTAIIAGLAACLCMDVKVVAGATGDYHTNLQAKAEAAVEFITSDDYDFGFVHVKAVDDAGHDRDVKKKLHYLRAADRMLATLRTALHAAAVAGKGEFALAVTGDHSTPVMAGDHSCEPVPFAIADVRAATAAFHSMSRASVPIQQGSVDGPPSGSTGDGDAVDSAVVVDSARGALRDGAVERPACATSSGGAAAIATHDSNNDIVCAADYMVDEVVTFSETAAYRGALGRFPGLQVMRVVKQVAGVLRLPPVVPLVPVVGVTVPPCYDDLSNTAAAATATSCGQ